MITKIVKINGDDFRCSADGETCRRVEYYGKSSDTKPVNGVKNADVFYEMDTKKVFLFDADASVWLEQ
ncbi:MAG: hypothetical protein J6Q53_04515 [Oscillospiraceae bacterium]|nr:hypothetical protein [Oscillospiraceae bacterium]